MEGWLSYLWLCVGSAPGLRSNRCMRYDFSWATGLYSGRLWAFDSAEPRFLNVSGVSCHAADLAHVHLRQRSTTKSCSVLYSPIERNWNAFISRLVSCIISHLCRGWLGSPLSVSTSPRSTVNSLFCVDGGRPVSPPCYRSLRFILWPTVGQCRFASSSFAGFIRVRSTLVPPGAPHSHILHVRWTIFSRVGALSLASPAGHRCSATAAAAFEARLRVVTVCRGGVWGLEAQVAALAAQVAGGRFHSGRVLIFWPGGGLAVVTNPRLLVLGWPRGYLALGNGDLIWNGDAAVVLTAGAWK